MTVSRLDHGEPLGDGRYNRKFEQDALDRAETSFLGLVSGGLDKAIAAETKVLREQIIEADAAHVEAITAFWATHQARMKRDRKMMAWMILLSWAAGVGMCWGFLKL